MVTMDDASTRRFLRAGSKRSETAKAGRNLFFSFFLASLPTRVVAHHEGCGGRVGIAAGARVRLWACVSS
jgi:hypothetical protein